MKSLRWQVGAFCWGSVGIGAAGTGTGKMSADGRGILMKEWKRIFKRTRVVVFLIFSAMYFLFFIVYEVYICVILSRDAAMCTLNLT